MNRLVYLVAFGVVFVLPPVSFAQETEPSYLAKVQDARQRLMEGQVAGALTVVREALASEANEPDAHCVLGDILSIQGESAGAIESFERCAAMAETSSDRRHQARGIIGQQRVLLALPERREDARRATMILFRFAEANPDVLSADDVRTRLQALDLVTERSVVAAEVRARREARAEANE